MTHNPEIFQLAVDVFVRRYASLDIDCIAGLDARGFVLGTPIALALKKVLYVSFALPPTHTLHPWRLQTH